MILQNVRVVQDSNCVAYWKILICQVSHIRQREGAMLSFANLPLPFLINIISDSSSFHLHIHSNLLILLPNTGSRPNLISPALLHSYSFLSYHFRHPYRETASKMRAFTLISAIVIASVVAQDISEDGPPTGVCNLPSPSPNGTCIGIVLHFASRLTENAPGSWQRYRDCRQPARRSLCCHSSEDCI